MLRLKHQIVIKNLHCMNNNNNDDNDNDDNGGQLITMMVIIYIDLYLHLNYL